MEENESGKGVQILLKKMLNGKKRVHTNKKFKSYTM